MNVLFLEDKELLRLIEKFMGYPNGFMSSIITWGNVMPIIQKLKIAANELWEKHEDCEPLKLKIDVWDNEVKWVDTETGHYPFPIYTSSDGDLIHNVVMSIIDFINWYNAKQ